ncbi:MAG TPA: DUF1801 domain-containing protein [Phycisphaerales bacterium]|nr:DUF1801 domain-containing protein [Phycisphaerales bacterium]
MPDKATTVKEYLATLSPDERASVEAVRKTILDNLDKEYSEGIQYGMIGYCVPHSVYPAGYHCDPRQPLPFAGIAARKGYVSLYLNCVYGNEGEREKFVEDWKKTGKKLDMGKSCIRFKKLDDIPLEVVGRAVKRLPAKKYIADYEAALAAMGKPRGPAKADKPAAKKAATKVVKKTAKKAAKKG